MVAYQGGKNLIAKELTRVILDRTPPPENVPGIGSLFSGAGLWRPRWAGTLNRRITRMCTGR